ncbi:MAG: phosphoglucosamine mutase [Pyrinomonadaceae bacterium]|jgi:phosphoglucosamine mutase|nr:phosphoglucosamine mutase [Pyrinomonadaceae bacterium]
MKKLFGTDGMRGEAGEFPLDEKTIEILGWSLARQLIEINNKNPKFITGRDTRESGEWIEKALHRGAIAGGAICESAEVITTPGVAFLTKNFGFDAGIVISASHNPFQDNGIKIFLPSGKKLDEATEREIEKDIYESRVESRESREVDSSKAEEFQNTYLDYLAEEFKSLSLNGLKLVVDCANGASSNLAPRLLEKFGAEIITIFNQPNGKNINTNCGSTHIENLQAKVLAEKADFGVAFDGDADRSLFVDENGNLVDGDAVLWITAQFLQSHNKLKKDTVVATVMSNLGLEIALKSKNINLLRTAVGDKYVLQSLLENDLSVGGEQSGHIIFPFRSLVGDGMLTALFLLETMFETGKSLSELTAGFKRFPQILVNVKVNEKRPFEEVKEIVEASKKVEDELDGKGRLLLRYSGTENLARVMIEGENQVEIERQANWLADEIKKALS